MANELNFYGTLEQTGLTIVARVYDAIGAQLGSAISCTEAGVKAIYYCDMPVAAAGEYGVRFFSGSDLVGQGSISWDGAKESIFNLDALVSSISGGGGSSLTLAEIESSTVLAKTADVTSLETNVIFEIDANETKIDTLTTNVSNLPVPLTSAQVRSEADDALVAYDGPTKAELDTAESNITTEVNTNETKIDLLETKAQADTRQTALIAEHDDTQVQISNIDNYDDTVLIGKVDSIQTDLTAQNDITVSEVVTGMQAVADDFKATSTTVDLTPIQSVVDDILIDTNELQINQGNWDTATGFSTHSESDVVTSLQLVADDFKADSVSVDLAPVQTVVDAILVDTNELQTNQGNWLTATGFSTHSASDVWSVASRELTSLPDATLSPATLTAIAQSVEQAILNDGDGDAVLNAIVGAIGNQNIDVIALVAAIRSDLERSGGSIDLIETKAEADDRQVALISEHSQTQTDISNIVVDNTAVLNAISALNDLSLSDVEGSTVLAKEATLNSIILSIANIPTDNTVDLSPVLSAISGLNDPTVAEIRAAFNEADFKDRNVESEIHAWLDSYVNKDSFKADIIDEDAMSDAVVDKLASRVLPC